MRVELEGWWFTYWWDVHSHHIGQGVVNIVDRSLVVSLNKLTRRDEMLSAAFREARDYEHRTSHKYLISKSVLEGIVQMRLDRILMETYR